MFTPIKKYCDSLTQEFDNIPSERKCVLEKITQYFQAKIGQNKIINVIPEELK